MKISFEKKKLELKVNWKISRNESLYKENYICSIEGSYLGFGECAPNIRYGETHNKIQNEISELIKCKSEIEISNYLNENKISHSLECAVRDALFFSKIRKKDVFQTLSLSKPKNVITSYSLPILEKDLIKDYIEKNNQYHVYKIKIKDENDLDLIQELSKCTNRPIRVDANEGFSDLSNYLKFEKELKGINIELIEQPFKSSMIEAYVELKQKTNHLIIADESIEKNVNFEDIEKCFHGVNIKLQKCGGIEQGLLLAKEALNRNLKVMIGCMIETSLGISHGLILSGLADYLDLDGSLLLKNDPYEFILENNGLLNLTD